MLLVFFILCIANYLQAGCRSLVSQLIFARYFGKCYELHVTETTHIALGKIGMGVLSSKTGEFNNTSSSDAAWFRGPDNDVKVDPSIVCTASSFDGVFPCGSSQHLQAYNTLDFFLPILHSCTCLDLSAMQVTWVITRLWTSLDIGINSIQIIWIKNWEEVLAQRKIKVWLSKEQQLSEENWGLDSRKQHRSTILCLLVLST